jgi:hypothetical protein
MNGQKFLSAVGHNAGYVFMQFFFEFRSNETLPGFNSKNDLNVELGVSVGHEAKLKHLSSERQTKFTHVRIAIGILGSSTPIGVACL